MNIKSWCKKIETLAVYKLPTAPSHTHEHSCLQKNLLFCSKICSGYENDDTSLKKKKIQCEANSQFSLGWYEKVNTKKLSLLSLNKHVIFRV